MEIKYGKKIKETTFIDSKPFDRNWVVYKDRVNSDAEELALFIRFQKESRNSKEATFTREYTKSSAGNANRYIERKWEV